MNYSMCNGKYSCYPQDCEMCSRYMDDCDGSGEEYQDKEDEYKDYKKKQKSEQRMTYSRLRLKDKKTTGGKTCQ